MPHPFCELRIRTIVWLAVLVAIPALPGTAAAQDTADAPSLSPRLLVDASWHGRPIRRPLPTRSDVADRAPALRAGTGFQPPRRLPARPRSATQAQPPGVPPRGERRALRPADPGRRARVPAQARARADRRRQPGDAARPAPPHRGRCCAGGRSAGRREPGAISARAAGPGRPGHPGLTGGYVRRLADPVRAPRIGARAAVAAGRRLARAAPAADRQGACAGSPTVFPASPAPRVPARRTRPIALDHLTTREEPPVAEQQVAPNEISAVTRRPPLPHAAPPERRAALRERSSSCARTA